MHAGVEVADLFRVGGDEVVVQRGVVILDRGDLLARGNGRARAERGEREHEEKRVAYFHAAIIGAPGGRETLNRRRKATT